LTASAVALSLSCSVAADDYDWTKDSPTCGDTSDLAAATAACTRIIDSGQLPVYMQAYIHLYRGSAFARLKNWQAAQDDLALAVERNLQDPDLRLTAEYNLQVARLELGQEPEARAGFWKIATDSNAFYAALAISVLASDPRIAEKDPAKLVEAARAVVAEHESALSHGVLGRALASAGKPDEAIAEIRKAADSARSVDPESAPNGTLSFALKLRQAEIEKIRAGKPIVEYAEPL